MFYINHYLFPNSEFRIDLMYFFLFCSASFIDLYYPPSTWPAFLLHLKLTIQWFWTSPWQTPDQIIRRLLWRCKSNGLLPAIRCFSHKEVGEFILYILCDYHNELVYYTVNKLKSYKKHKIKEYQFYFCYNVTSFFLWTKYIRAMIMSA